MIRSFGSKDTERLWHRGRVAVLFHHACRINEIVHGKRRISADTALRLGRYFGRSAQFWLNLQSHYDLDVDEDRAAEQLAASAPLKTA